jgi:hypothetical protein
MYAQKSGVPFVNVQAGFYASNFSSTFKHLVPVSSLKSKPMNHT